MRVVLVKPPWYCLQGSGLNEIPIGLSSLASFLNSNGHTAAVLNADTSGRSGVEYRQLYGNYEKYLAVLRDLTHPLWAGVLADIAGFSPDVVGITLTTGAYRSACNIAALVKEKLPGVVVVAGGPHATILPEETAREGCFDYVARGEAEITVAELLSRIEAGRSPSDVAGLTYLNGSTVVHTPDRPFIDDLDRLPFLERDAHLSREHYSPDAYGLLMTGRGCPFACTFCASERIWKRKVRFRSPGNVLDEISLVREKYRTTHIKFRDDTFTLKKDRAMEICEGIIRKGLAITWQCDTRADCLDDELVRAMKRSGCIGVSIGVESGSPRILADIRKGETREQMECGVSLLHRHGINVTVFAMVGFPGESPEEIAQTFAFARGLNPDHIVASILTPYPGTRIYDQFLDLGLIHRAPSWESWFHQSPETGLLGMRGDIRPLVERFLANVERYNTSPVRKARRIAVRLFRNPRGFARRAVGRMKR